MRLTHRSLLKTLLGASLWGLSGTAAQALFQIYKFPVVGLLTIRMLVSGAVLLAVLRPSKPSRPILPLILLSIFGYAGSQFFYLAAIQFSNAATATLLQFLFLPMVAAYESLTGSLRWSHRWTLTLALAATGTLLLVVGSTFKVLVTPIGLATGLTAAVAAAYYTLGSRHYVRSLGSWWITCWGFTIGGLVTLPFGLVALRDYVWPPVANDQLEISLLVSFVIVFGTILAFGLYVSGLQNLSATETGVASSAEPIMSAIAAYAFLGVVLTPTQYFGGAIMISAVVLVATRARQVKQENPRPIQKA
jgi:drug/metabolite transporter (DMT)-like permease